MKFELLKLKNLWLAISGTLVAVSIFLVATLGLNLGIDFTGGSLYEWQIEGSDVNDVRTFFDESELSAKVQASDDGVFLVRTETITAEQHDSLTDAAAQQFESFDELRFESIGPVIGQELKNKSFTALILLAIAIVIYVAWAFRQVSEPVASWKYGLLTIIAALHDIIIPLGVFAVLGRLIGFEIDTAFIAALLTILGYSINDTIVVFDRTRENLQRERHVSKEEFKEIIDRSVRQTLGRSINTSFTTLLVLLAIYFFGGSTTQSFVLALMIGIVSGAYSSIFLASPLLYILYREEK